MGYMTTPSAAGQVMVLSEPVDARYAPAPDSPFQGAPATSPNIVDETNLPPNTVTIVEGTDVVDRSGEKIGTVDEIIYGADDRIDAIIVSEGFFFKHHVRIPAEWIETAGHEHIIIDRLADEAERAGRID
jgi:sporulation protein YlmC with PRC-barrel domain